MSQETIQASAPASLMQSSQMGHIKEITSTANPIVKSIKALALKKNRDSENLFMAEGLKLVTDAIQAGWEISTLVYSIKMRSHEHLQKIALKVRADGGDILEVTDKVLSAISRRDNPQTVIGIFKQQWQSLDQLAKLLIKGGDVLVALDRVRDPGNLGTIIRTADAVGAKGLLLIGETTDPYSIEASRATMGSIFNLPMARIDEADFIDWCEGFPFRICGTHLEGAVDYRTIAWDQKPVIVLMGNEQQGLSDPLAKICDDLVLLPMAGKADSLNLAIATGITLFEVRRSFLKLADNIEAKT